MSGNRGVPGRVSLADAVSALASLSPGVKPFAESIARGTLRVGLYAPRGKDPSSRMTRTRSMS